MTKKCETPSCDRPAYCAGLCAPCYAGIHYWMKRGVGNVVNHLRRRSA